LSLSPLANILSSLTNRKLKHIPHRDSKITRILQASLGGNAKTILIANIVLNDTHFEETMLTLRFADRAKKVKNIAKINYRNSLLKAIQQELESLKAE